MPAIKGRDILVSIDGTPVAGVRAKSITINGSPIDITSDDDAGVRKLMDEPGQVDVNISVSGVAINQAVLRALSLNRTDRVKPMTFMFGGSPGNGFQGQFFMQGYTESGEHTGPATFECDFLSADTVTYA